MIRKIETQFYDCILFVEEADCREKRRAVIGADSRTGGVGHRADRAGSRFRLGRVSMNTLHRRCPQHQRQAEPHRPAFPEAHEFLLGG